MSLLKRVSPNYFTTLTTSRIMRDLTIALCVVFASSTIWLFINQGSAIGIHVILMLVVAVAVALITESVYALLRKQPILETLKSSFGWVTAIILVLMCRTNVDLYAIGAATFLCLVLAKLIFGGFGQNIFNPAAVGRALIMLMFSARVVADLSTSATPASTMNGLQWLGTADTMASAQSTLGGYLNWFLGYHEAAIGEMCSLILILACVFLIIRKVIDWRIPVFYIGTVVLIAAAVVVFKGLSLLYIPSVVFSGGLLFGAVFMATDPVTNPTSASGRVYFAIGCGILTMVIRLFANLPEGVLFSILIMNALTPAIESFCDRYVIQANAAHRIILSCLVIVGALGIGSWTLTIQAKSSAPAVDVPTEPVKEGIKIMDETEVGTVDPAESTVSGNLYTVIVRADGYGKKFHSELPNKFTIVIDKAAATIQSVEVTVFNDTEGVGDKIEQPTFLNQFKGLSISDASITAETVTGATVSSRSAIAAVKAAITYVNGQ